VNLEEMNGIIRKMKLGEDAIREMAELDANRGMTGKVRQRDDFGREVGAPNEFSRGANVAGSDAARALDDASIAQDLKSQAARMAAEAKALLAESARIMKEASALVGTPVATEPKRGRPAKSKAADATQA
jgi:hypothetical protein